MRTRLCITACVLLAATLTTRAGQSAPGQQPPIFRTGADFIRVDMYATLDGQFVTDLGPEEVEVLEDGVRQKIETFEYVQIDRAGDDGPPVAPGLDARSRVFVVFVDTHTTRLEGRNELRLELVRFLDQLLSPTDLVGLMTPDMGASEMTLGRRSSVISDLANDERWLRRLEQRPDLQEFAWENCYPSSRGVSSRLAEMRARHRGRNTIEALQDLVGHLRGLREERKAVLLVTAGWPFEEAMSSSGGRVESDRCAADRLALDRINFGALLRDLGRAANRANVSFYPVSSRQEQRFPPELRASTRALLRQRDKRAVESIQKQLRTLADETDGLAEVKSTDLDAVTARIVSDTSSYYLLGYQSSQPRTDGRFRTITVKVNRPGVRVRARRGYGGETLRPAVDEDAAVKPVVDARILTALTFVERFDARAPFWGRPSAWDSDEGGGAFWYVGELGTEVRNQAPWNSGVTAEVMVTAADRTQVMSRVVDLVTSDSTFALRVPEEGNLPKGDYSVRVRLRGVSQEEWAVHDTLRVTLDASRPALGEPVFWRRGASVLTQYGETADPRFRRTERLRLEFPTMSQSTASVRLLDRVGAPLRIPAAALLRTDASREFHWVVVEAPVGSLAPGDYALEVTQDDVSRITVFRIVP